MEKPKDLNTVFLPQVLLKFEYGGISKLAVESTKKHIHLRKL